MIELARPQPPQDLLSSGLPLFQPAPEVAAWFGRVFIEPDGALFNEDHAHLLSARISVLWTNVIYRKGMKDKAATAEIPRPPASQPRWAKERQNYQLRQWFGDIPDFLITIFAPVALYYDDATFCALIEHGLYHCAQLKDEFGDPIHRRDGRPVFAIRSHDVEQFNGVVRRYGVEAAGVTEMVEAAAMPPLLRAASIAGACGTCPA